MIKRVLENVGREYILGIFHCSGGGQTKIGKFGQMRITYVKDRLFPIPPLFEMLHQVRGLSWREMFETYNMGHRLEMVVPSRSVAEDCIAIAAENNIEAKVIGDVVAGTQSGNNRTLIIRTPGGDEAYDF